MQRDPLIAWHVIIAGLLLGSLAVWLIDQLDGPLGIVPAIAVVAAAFGLVALVVQRRRRG